ncbi:hypothetical protein SEA_MULCHMANSION_237 [Streptomyces phage MulchMansion]|nr:hypothetical protein SEA_MULCHMANSION_237 [Streptomyces phage MulchMansion]UVK61289.1 hypothetical protein SEA_ANGELA_237 [Streptomyces phage Angela]
MNITREQSKRPNGHVGPVRFSFSITVEAGIDETVRARNAAMADAKAWCNEMNAPELVFQFESVDIGWTNPDKLTYTGYFGTGLYLEKGPGE